MHLVYDITKRTNKILMMCIQDSLD